MWPGMRPATGWMANRTCTPWSMSSCASSHTLCCAWATASPYPGTMMTFCAYAIITPASEASIAFCVPVTVPPPAEVSPKFANSTLPSERFMAFAMSCVSSVPAAPTTVPAMIMAALSSTKPSKPTARPVSALYSEMTTGISAPPIGSVMAMPRSSAHTKKSVTAGRPES